MSSSLFFLLSFFEGAGFGGALGGDLAGTPVGDFLTGALTRDLTGTFAAAFTGTLMGTFTGTFTGGLEGFDLVRALFTLDSGFGKEVLRTGRDGGRLGARRVLTALTGAVGLLPDGSSIL